MKRPDALPAGGGCFVRAQTLGAIVGGGQGKHPFISGDAMKGHGLFFSYGSLEPVGGRDQTLSAAWDADEGPIRMPPRVEGRYASDPAPSRAGSEGAARRWPAHGRCAGFRSATKAATCSISPMHFDVFEG